MPKSSDAVHASGRKKCSPKRNDSCATDMKAKSGTDRVHMAGVARKSSVQGFTSGPSPGRFSGTNYSVEHKKLKSIFPKHWNAAAVQHGLETGTIFRACLRCNTSDRTQGYCTVPGLPRDIFIRGWKAQNRAIEGDVVAMRILPTSEWYQQNKNATSHRSVLDSDTFSPNQQAKRNIELYRLPDGRNTASSSKNIHDDTALFTRRTPTPSSSEDAEDVTTVAICDKTGVAVEKKEDEDSGDLDDSDEVDELFKAGRTTAFVAAQLDGTGISDVSSMYPASDESLPWASAGSTQEATSILASLLSGQFEGWQATAEIVAIVVESPRRRCVVGVLHKEGSGLIWESCDPRLPRGFVRERSIPHSLRLQLLEEASRVVVPCRTLVFGAIVSWDACRPFPHIAVASILGRAGDLEAEVAVLLAEQRIKDDDTFNSAVLGCLPTGIQWQVSSSDCEGRRDLREQRIFSIDPPTARDLDDALSIEDLGNGFLRIGVHIADVSHFVRPGTALDREAAQRSTSVYLIDRVIPMLPRTLCEEVCSLNPGVDRLAISIIWDMTQQGNIRKTRVERTIIRSCTKLTYPSVQAIIDSSCTCDIPAVDAVTPPKGIEVHGTHCWADIVRDIIVLHKVSSEMRCRRFDVDGALRLDNVRLHIHTDEAGNPIDFGILEQGEANRLVEEFMLAANMTAAQIIADAFPERALLRCHPPPNSSKMRDLATTVRDLLPNAPLLEVESAGALQASLQAVRHAVGPCSAVSDIVTLLCTKPMQNARYFCTGDAPDSKSWLHYALSVTHYAHFTSPIRRYPDIVVHRLLMAAKRQNTGERDSSEVPLQDELSSLAEHANDRKTAAKAAQDGALRLYLASLLLNEPRVHKGIVSVLRGLRFFDVYVPALGLDVRVHIDSLLRDKSALAAMWNSENKSLVLDVVSDGMPENSRPNFDDIENASQAINPSELARMKLPVILSPLCSVSLLIGARRSKTSGSPAAIVAKLWLADQY